ncbi:hypothetical protein SS7213T_08822 [Staphylococcus simiae CCM 7213 = CCUG 51256]|uniref:Uncharacterized protein n=1 Tax=Staphylococcus simiae CCM 7213 = CCUG 51256 TaxID=911238 RepID=G5JJV5_9STAP|nr:hypothetical protein SS7213T_08822 [Staphylococcus simiae CCM 7213 = CCUG 51256]SNV75477.1 Protein of uncharacterised function (DUF1270) [Staphylococcus simiae]
MSDEMATYWFNFLYERGLIHEVLREEGIIAPLEKDGDKKTASEERGEKMSKEYASYLIATLIFTVISIVLLPFL